jgi:hypothetical protein
MSHTLSLSASSFVTDLRLVANGTHIGALLLSFSDGSVQQFGNKMSFGRWGQRKLAHILGPVAELRVHACAMHMHELSLLLVYIAEPAAHVFGFQDVRRHPALPVNAPGLPWRHVRAYPRVSCELPFLQCARSPTCAGLQRVPVVYHVVDVHDCAQFLC